MKGFRALDGSEAWFVRSIELPGMPFVGMTLSFGEEFLQVDRVHVYVEQHQVVAMVTGSDLTVSPEMAPKNRLELEALVAREGQVVGWVPLPKPLHLHLVK